ncbi:delta-sarcoglycan isoform X14 [Amazona aestiva]|uniref:Delta-sarcoglycan isoform X14 n=43 Tax=Neoaves TaxID=3078114 RepID=A0A0Q3MRP8_AMAAE|nr:delta-sarcoglycan isoform X14 [Amazona aestiva]
MQRYSGLAVLKLFYFPSVSGVVAYWVHPLTQESLVAPSAGLGPNQSCADIAQADVAICSSARVKDYSTSCKTGMANAFSPVLKQVQGSLHHQELMGPDFGPVTLSLHKMPQEQYAHRSTMQTSEGPQVYKVGIYGWRKRCLYFFVLLLMILILVNLAMTIWILKVMNFTIDGMGNLRITEKGLKLEGDSEFLKPLYAKEIRSRPGNPLYFQSARNVTVNILNEKTKVLTRLVTGPQAVEAHSQKFEVKTLSGKLLFSADDNEVVVGAERLRVLGAEGTVFPKSIETPNVRADPFKELRLESPTRALVMEAPKGIEINAEAGSLKATCRTELRLESKDGEITLNSAKIKLPNLPQGSSSSAGSRQKIYELCVCPNGRLFLSQAGTSSTCQINTSVCL